MAQLHRTIQQAIWELILGAATGAILADGSGYWWPPYCNAGYYYPYPATYCGAYYGYGYHYGTPYYDYNTGAYGWKGSASGVRTDQRLGGLVTILIQERTHEVVPCPTPYGSRSAAQAYNPYTGTYAQTRQGSNPNAQWGSSYVSRGNQSATMGHYSTANGTVAGAADSAGGKAAASSTNGETQQPAKPPAATCMPDTMATSIRTRVTVGRSTIMAAGTR